MIARAQKSARLGLDATWRAAARRTALQHRMLRASSYRLLSSGIKVLPKRAKVVIVGGGIIGNSVAYHLGHMGIKDVILLEQAKLTAGTTWHAAGLMVTFGSTSETSTEIRKYTKQLYKDLEAETGQSTGFMPVGFIELATERDRLEEYRRVASFNRRCGVDVQEIDAKEVQKLFPLARTEDVLAGFYVKDDGRVNPIDAAMALAKGARMKGVNIFEGISVNGVMTSRDESRINKRVTGVTLSTGEIIEAEYVVNCAGMWARQFGQECGVNIPNQAAEHYYLLTDAISEVDPSWPVIEDPASYTYIRPEGGGLMVGLFEPVAAAWNVNNIPGEFSFGEIEPDWERMGPYVEKAMNRVPISLKSGIKKLFCGPESFTPDLQPIVGEAPELRNYFVAAGLNSIGILSGGGIGRLVASWIANGKPNVDVTQFNIDRLHTFQANPNYRAERVVETLGMVYKTHYPYKSKESARGSKRSAFYDRLVARGAYFKDVSGWEGADWYAPQPAEGGFFKPSMGVHSWKRYDWFPNWKKEHEACREGVMLMDMSFMSKFLVQGVDAGEALNYLSTANVNGAKNNITYTQWLNSDGKMEADLTVSKLDDDKFFVVATDTMHRHVETWARRHLDPEGCKHVFLTDVTGAYAQLNIQGPKSRALMSKITDCDMSNEAFPFRTIKEISIGYARLYCARITYVGELGYELHIPCEHALHVYETIVAAGKELQLVHSGLKALASLRMEKAYRDYGHDMDNTDTLLEVGLGFTADYTKPGGFIGKDCVAKQKDEMKMKGGLSRRLCQVLCLDPQPLMYHAEIVWRNGKRIGDIRSASYGHTLGGAIGLALIDSSLAEEPGSVINKKFIDEGKWEVEIAGEFFPCKVSLSPLYDPNNKRIKA